MSKKLEAVLNNAALAHEVSKRLSAIVDRAVVEACEEIDKLHANKMYFEHFSSKSIAKSLFDAKRKCHEFSEIVKSR